MNENDKYIGRMLEDRYEILELIGEGGMAVVYKALCHRLNRYVAVKIMREDLAEEDEDFKRRFCAESQAVAMLSHPNIVAVYDVSHSDEDEFIVMELVDGITLKQYMSKKGALSWKEAAHFSKQIARALCHAHARGIVHRDIKPQNVMLLKDGTIKVADFGIAALENEVHEDKGQAIGSIHYIAPEQARGENPDARSDIFSLGVVMYEMLTATLPFIGDTLSEVAVKHLEANPALIRNLVENIPLQFENIVYKALNPQLERRYQTAKELLDDIEDLILTEKQSEDTAEEEPVKPVRSVSELSKKDYAIRRRRAGKVSFSSGVFFVIASCVALFVLLWNFWLNDVFSPVERIMMPKLTGNTLDMVLNSSDPVFKFNVTYVVDSDYTPGQVISQEPIAGRSLMLTQGGISVNVTVCAGASVNQIPNVSGMNYREAILTLEHAGFAIEIENICSTDTVKDTVIGTSPSAGESLNTGSLIFLMVSCGQNISYVDVPNVVGLSEEAAKAKIESFNLTYGGCERRINENYPGTVIEQSIASGVSLEEHSPVYLVISSGPQG